MRALIQRVTEASVIVGGETIASINRGFLILLGVTHEDTLSEVEVLSSKIANLRIFEDEGGAMNRSAIDLQSSGEDISMLVVSQFTLYADARKGRRPSFVKAARPEIAAPLVDAVAIALRGYELPVQQGRFGAEMQVVLVNDGPVTIWLDSAEFKA